MSDYVAISNSLPLYLIVGVVLLFIALISVYFMVRSYKAGIRIGMDKAVLRKAIISSASFTVLPSVSILLGVAALSGSLGVPAAWLRLSVIGNLQYEATVASIAAESMGKTLDSAVLNMDDLVTILLVMTVGIIWGCVFSILFLKPYSKKIRITKRSDGKKGFADWAMTAMFIGLCSAFLGSYVGRLAVYGELIPILTAIISAAVMLLFQYLIEKRGMKDLESFSLAASMLVGMAFAAILSLFIGA